jgi:hypothetical protein
MERRFLISGEKWREIGFDITNSHRERDFRSHFGGSSDAIAWLWYLIRSYVPKLPKSMGSNRITSISLLFEVSWF